MATPIEYTVRRNALEAQRTWRLDDSALSWSAEDGADSIPLADITAIRLSWDASRANHKRYGCHVSRGKWPKETIISTHYAGIYDFPDQRDSYVPFVSELVKRTASVNAACHFQAGSSVAGYLGNTLFMVAAFILMAAVILSIGVVFTGIIIAKFLVIAALAPLAFVWIWKNRPRRFDPARIPDDVLPLLN